MKTPRIVKASKLVKIAQTEGDPVSAEILATSIRSIAQGFARLEASGLNRRALTVLIKDTCGVGLSEIDYVLNALRNLEKNYTRPRT